MNSDDGKREKIDDIPASEMANEQKSFLSISGFGNTISASD